MPIVLPKGKKCAVILSWDFDAMSAFVLRGETTPTFISQGEFGARVGVPRVLDLCDKYNFKTTFFVPAWTIEVYPELTKRIFDKGHEIAHHMWCHEDAPQLSLEKELELMEKANEVIKRVTGKYSVGNRSGGFANSNSTIKLMEDHSPLVRGHAAWAWARILGNDALPVLEKRYEREQEEKVRGEITMILHSLHAG